MPSPAGTKDVILGVIQDEDHDAVAALLHRSLVQWYESRLGQGNRFGDSAEPFRLFPKVYEALDPGESVAARDVDTGALLGVCFIHARETHVSVGIVATAPEAAGRGVAKLMMLEAAKRAKTRNQPLRLVSSLLNLDSFSLYSRLGFTPQTLFQDVAITVPEAGLPGDPPRGISRVRLARANEAKRIADFELTWQGLRREKDHAFFLNNAVGDWRTWVMESDSGELEGFLTASVHTSFRMVGPGATCDGDAAAALLWAALDAQRGTTTVVLVPCAASAVVRWLYTWGGRNVELHASQVLGLAAPARGLSFPTFLPESA